MSLVDRLEKRILLAAGVPDHIVVVIEENRSNAEIIANPDAPFMNSLADRGLRFFDSHGETHPSQPNYLALFSGSMHGVVDNSGPNDFINVPNLGGQLFKAGKSFIGYAEDLPEVGSKVLTEGLYDRRHNPWVDFDDVPDSSNRPFADFPTDYSSLPTVSFVVPNEQHNSHDGTIPDADAWLQANLRGYADWAKTHNSLLIVTWDEGFDPANHIPTMFYGANVSPGFYFPTINHYSILRTLEDLYGLTPLGKALNSPGIDYLHLPSLPDMTSASDSGIDQADNITNINTPTFTGIARTGQKVVIYADGFEAGHATAANDAYSIKVSPLSHGPHSILAATVDSAGNFISFSASLNVTIDRAAPKVTQIQFNGQNSSANTSRIGITFDETVAVTLSQLVLHNDSTNMSISTASKALNYDPATHQAIWTFPGLPMGMIENGHYTATLSASVTDLAGNPLDGNGNGVPGDARVFKFFQLAGDVNADGAVNAADFKLFHDHLGATAPADPADLNGDGQVGFVDFQILELNYGQSLPAASIAASEGIAKLRMTAPPPPRTVGRAVFAIRRIGRHS